MPADFFIPSAAKPGVGHRPPVRLATFALFVAMLALTACPDKPDKPGGDDDDGCLACLEATASHETLTVNGAQRSYVIYKPAGYILSRTRFPLVFAFHGDGSDGTRLREDFGLAQGFESLVDNDGGAIVVYPDGLHQSWFWRDGADSAEALAEDMAFVEALVDTLAEKTTPGSVFATGVSRGAYFVNTLALQSRTAFKAIATHAGYSASLGASWTQHWTVDGKDLYFPVGKNQPMAALQVHGEADAAEAYASGLKSSRDWRGANRCDDVTSKSEAAAQTVPVTAARTYTANPCVAYQGCLQPTVWCSLPPPQGHDFWRAPSVVAGATQAAFLTWNFFTFPPVDGPKPPHNPQFRGINLAGMEVDYNKYSLAIGPQPGQVYAVFEEGLIDYYASKKIASLRFLFSWEAMQPVLNGPIPGTLHANYTQYFNDYKRIVDYATGKGMQVIVAPWNANAAGGAGGARWRGQVVGSNEVPVAAFADFWGKMAGIFKDNPLVSFGLINEPNNQSTLLWFAAAQAAISAIREAGATQRIFVPGNGYSPAGGWTYSWYDAANPQRSNAYGWLNANGEGKPLVDPLNNMAVEVHAYLNEDGSGGSTCIKSVSEARQLLGNTVYWAKEQGLKVYLGEIGFWAGFDSQDASTYPASCNPSGTFTAADAWADFINYFEAHADTLVGYSWWAGGDPTWWPNQRAGNFSVSPLNRDYTGDTANMRMIEGDF